MSEQTTAIDLDLRNDFNDKVPRVRDIDLGKKLGLAQPRDVRRTIDAHLRILNACGVVARRARTSGPLGGRPTTEYWLNREQALIDHQVVLPRLPPRRVRRAQEWRQTLDEHLLEEAECLHEHEEGLLTDLSL